MSTPTCNHPRLWVHVHSQAPHDHEHEALCRCRPASLCPVCDIGTLVHRAVVMASPGVVDELRHYRGQLPRGLHGTPADATLH